MPLALVKARTSSLDLIAAADGDGGAFHIGVINIGDGEGPVDDGALSPSV